MAVRLLIGDARERLAKLPAESIDCCVSSPPYWGLRDYGVEGQLGLEDSPEVYVARLVEIFREVRRVLKPTGTLWLNLGDNYNAAGREGHGTRVGYKQNTNRASAVNQDTHRATAPNLKPKDLIGIPWMVAFALRADGWWLRSDIIWAKPNPMPESVTDRPTSAHEHVFLLSKSARYFFDAEAVREIESVPDWDDGTRVFGGKNKHGANTQHGHRTTGRLATKRRIKIPGGWDRGEGAHGTIHRDGRTSAEYQETSMKPGRNIRNVWNIATAPFPEAHFATFAPALAERCIKAGSSEKGCCQECGAPWLRQTNVTYSNPGNRSTNGPRSIARRHETAGFETRLERHAKTTGWIPSCKCASAEPIPAIVLDPFAGAGTTGLVADRLGRDALLIELKPEYAEMARRRIEGDAPMFSKITLEATP